ncbi:hypothetical protein ALPO108162_03765 [Alicyclobacillus pomorum]
MLMRQWMRDGLYDSTCLLMNALEQGYCAFLIGENKEVSMR